jgi:hypothetical protein
LTPTFSHAYMEPSPRYASVVIKSWKIAPRYDHRELCLFVWWFCIGFLSSLYGVNHCKTVVYYIKNSLLCIHRRFKVQPHLGAFRVKLAVNSKSNKWYRLGGETLLDYSSEEFNKDLPKVQKLYGKLMHVTLVVPSGRTYLTSLRSMLGIFKDHPFLPHTPPTGPGPTPIEKIWLRLSEMSWCMLSLTVPAKLQVMGWVCSFSMYSVTVNQSQKTKLNALLQAASSYLHSLRKWLVVKTPCMVSMHFLPYY